MTSGCGRIARLLPPGLWWYIAVCEEHRWVGMSWKHKENAEGDLAHYRNFIEQVSA